jgi:rRNA pseudouridine-1189 N-methylase Emg1 (Nep1/Mra1 family)
LRVCIHVQFPAEKMIMIDPETRIPRSLNRFEGIMVNALAPGKNTPELFMAEDISLASFLDRFEPRFVQVFSTLGTSRTFDQFLPGIAELATSGEHDVVLIVGGFQAGHFTGTWQDRVLPDHVHSIAPMALDAWTVVARVVFLVEEAIAAAMKCPSCSLTRDDEK